MQRGLPISLVAVDYFSWADPLRPGNGSTPLGDEELNPACWPDPAAMLTELRQMDVELMV